MSMDLQANFPQISTPLVGSDGKLTTPWYLFLATIFNRTGQAQGGDLAALQQQVDHQEAEIGELMMESGTNPVTAAFGVLLAKVAYLERLIASQITPLPQVSNRSLPEAVFIPVRQQTQWQQDAYSPAMWIYPANRGTAGQVMTSNGPTTNPTWQTLGTMAAQNANAVAITGGTAALSTLTLTDSSGGTSTLTVTATSGTNGANIKMTGNGANPNKYMRAQGGNWQVVNSAYSAVIMSLTDAGALTISSGLTVGSTTLITSSVALTNGAAAASATLTNAPVAGNPTKWVPINDNGTTRYIPAW